MAWVLTQDEVFAVVARHFGDLSNHTVAIMAAIVFAESGGNVRAIGDNVASGHQPAGSLYHTDYGLAQINSVHNYDSMRLLTDPDYNLAAARDIYNRQGFGAWSTYRYGKWVPHYVKYEGMSGMLTTYDVGRLWTKIAPGLPRMIRPNDIRITELPRRDGKRRFEIEMN